MSSLSRHRKFHHQRGVSVLSFVIYLLLLIGLFSLSVKVFPSVHEYFSIVQVVKDIPTNISTDDARIAFDQGAQVNNITAISGRSLDIFSDGRNLQIRFAYRKEIKLTGPLTLLIDYSGGSK